MITPTDRPASSGRCRPRKKEIGGWRFSTFGTTRTSHSPLVRFLMSSSSFLKPRAWMRALK